MRLPSLRIVPAALLAAGVLVAPDLGQEVDSRSAVDARRAVALERARAYLEVEWLGEERHRMHGEDDDGTPVHTPDAEYKNGGWKVGARNRGVAYKWGGFDRPEDFVAGLEAGRLAGHWPEDPSDLRTTDRAVGVDCSGFVSRCMGWHQKRSTRSIGPLCFTLGGWSELQPGDIINNFDGHAMLFTGFTNDAKNEVRVIESTWPGVIESTYTIARLERAKHSPLRYKPLDPRWPEFEPAPEAAVPSGNFTAAADGAALKSPWANATAGQWLRYEMSEAGVKSELTRRVGAAADDHVMIVSTSRYPGDTTGDSIERLDRAGRGESVAASVLALFQRGQAPTTFTVTEERVTPGRYAYPGGSMAASRVEVRGTGTFVVRTNVFEFDLELEAVVAHDLPVEGVLTGTQTVTFKRGETESRSIRHLRAVAMGRIER